MFGTFLNSDGDTLYFTGGPNNQTNGLFWPDRACG